MICASVKSKVPIAFAVSPAVGVTYLGDAEHVEPQRLAVELAPSVATETTF